MDRKIIRGWLGAWWFRLIGADRRAAVLFGRILNRRRCVSCAWHYAAIAERHGRFEHAEFALSLLASWEPGDAGVWRALARIRMRLGDWQSAVQALRELVKRQPSDHGAWLELADAHMALHEYAYAIPPLRKAQALIPDRPYPLYLIGICQHHCGNERALREVVERIAHLDLQRASLLLAQTGRTGWRIPGVSC